MAQTRYYTPTEKQYLGSLCEKIAVLVKQIDDTLLAHPESHPIQNAHLFLPSLRLNPDLGFFFPKIGSRDTRNKEAEHIHKVNEAQLILIQKNIIEIEVLCLESLYFTSESFTDIKNILNDLIKSEEKATREEKIKRERAAKRAEKKERSKKIAAAQEAEKKLAEEKAVALAEERMKLIQKTAEANEIIGKIEVTLPTLENEKRVIETKVTRIELEIQAIRKIEAEKREWHEKIERETHCTKRIKQALEKIEVKQNLFFKFFDKIDVKNYNSTLERDIVQVTSDISEIIKHDLINDEDMRFIKSEHLPFIELRLEKINARKAIIENKINIIRNNQTIQEHPEEQIKTVEYNPDDPKERVREICHKQIERLLSDQSFTESSKMKAFAKAAAFQALINAIDANGDQNIADMMDSIRKKSVKIIEQDRSWDAQFCEKNKPDSTIVRKNSHSPCATFEEITSWRRSVFGLNLFNRPVKSKDAFEEICRIAEAARPKTAVVSKA